MPTNKPKLLIIPGEGIGHEVIPQAIRIVGWFKNNRKRTPDAAAETALRERAVEDTVAHGIRAADIKSSKTRAMPSVEMGDAALHSLNHLNG